MRRPETTDSLRLCLVLILFLVLGIALPASAQEGNPYRLKPGARGPLCLECHVDIQDQMLLASVHTPVESGECSDCHSPHASAHGQLLSEDPASICASCHDDLLPTDPVSIHGALQDGGCASCHDPHASPNAGNLLYPGNELCFTCHASMKAQVEDGEFQHAPAVEDCLSCHDPHASDLATSLLKNEVSALCADCHDVSKDSFLQRHNGYPVAGSDCASCHDPHGSGRSGILRTQLHEPVGNRMCSQCHQDASAADPLQTRRPGVELCAGCHNDVINELYSQNQIHWPVVEGAACGNCHAPHASDEPALLLSAPQDLCGGCHGETIEAVMTSLDQHPPVAAGECSACHTPHAGPGPFLLKSADNLELCGDCHDWQTHSSHPIGEKIVDPRNPNLTVDCSSCHRAHGSPFQGLAHLDLGGEMCVQCHEGMKR